MAEAMLKKMLQENQKQNIEVCSSGIYAQTGDMSTQDAIEVMKEYDIDLSNHRATNTEKSQIKNMDLILCATMPHKITILHLYPELKSKVYTIKEYADLSEQNNLDISDPWGHGIATYQKCAAQIEQCLKQIINKL